MAGYMTILAHYNYEGRFEAAEDLKNGDFVEIVNQKVSKVTAASDYTFRVVEKDAIGAHNVLRLSVIAQGAKDLHLVENLAEHMCGDADEADWVVKEGKFARIHRLQAGEEFLTSAVTTEVFNAAVAGDMMNIGAGGALAKVVP